jgi:hypothetical protein
MRRIICNFCFWALILPAVTYGQNPSSSVQKLSFITTAQVAQDIRQNGKASKYFETAMDLIYLDESLASVINSIQPDAVTPENLDMIKYINGRDQKPYREVWDHNVYMKYESPVNDASLLLTDQEALADLKKRLGREFNKLDNAVFTNGPDRIMFILRSPNSQAGSFYRAIVGSGTVRIDEISNWRDS